MRYKHLLFDADGTLYDFEATQARSITTLFGELKIEITDTLMNAYALANNRLWEDFEQGKVHLDMLKYHRFHDFFASQGITADADLAALRYLELLAAGDDIYQWTVPLLQQLRHKGYQLTLITNGIAQVQRGRLEATGTTELYDEIIIGEEVGYHKPDPRFFDFFLRSTNRERQEALIIGDSLTSDVAGGLAAGIDTCWFNHSHLEAPLEGRPTWTIRALEELWPLLDSSA